MNLINHELMVRTPKYAKRNQIFIRKIALKKKKRITHQHSTLCLRCEKNG